MSESKSSLPNLLAVSDSKSLYDSIAKEQYTGAEKRSALEICVIRNSLKQMNGTARWVPHQENPSDCLTKLKGNTARLLELLQKGSYTKSFKPRTL